MTLELLALVWAPVLAQAPERRVKDTAGTFLVEVWNQAYSRYPDAALLSIDGRTDLSGSAVCAPKEPMSDGWRYHFYSPGQGVYLLVGRCGGAIAGPLKEMRAFERGTDRIGIRGKFMDNDQALAVLKDNGVDMDPTENRASGKRPFTMILFRTEDPRYAEHPVFWEVKVGRSSFIVNAENQKLLRERPVEPSEGPLAAPGAGRAPGTVGSEHDLPTDPLAARPKKRQGYTARRDLAQVKEYVRSRMPGAILMAVDGIADAWGNVSCVGYGDGWAYYYYWPKTRAIETVFSCNGKVGEGRSAFIPVEVSLHQALDADFVDSDKAFDALLQGRPYVLNEGLGRLFTRKASLRLLRYKSPPLSNPAYWTAKLLWTIEVGSEVFYVDALKGVLLDDAAKP